MSTTIHVLPFVKGDLICWSIGHSTLRGCFPAICDPEWDGEQWLYGKSRVNSCGLRRASESDISDWLNMLRDQWQVAERLYRDALELSRSWAAEQNLPKRKS